MIPDHLRKKRIWDTKDFAEFLGKDTSQWQAKELLKTYDKEMSGMLLIRSKGANRKYTFHPSQLAKAFPALFDEIEGLAVRVDEIEEKLGDLYDRQNLISRAVGNTSRELAKLRRGRAA